MSSKQDKLSSSLRDIESRTASREAKQKELAAYLDNLMEKKTEDGEPLIKFDAIQSVQESSPDTQESTPTKIGNEDTQESTPPKPCTEIVLATNELSRDERLMKLQADLQAMKDQMNDDNLPIVQFPNDFDEILENCYEHDSYAREIDEDFTPLLDGTDWISLSITENPTPDAKNFRKEREKIRKLDRILRQKGGSRGKEDLGFDDPTFITKKGGPSRPPRSATKSVNSMQTTSTKRTIGDKVQQNIDNAFSDVKSLTDRLSIANKSRLGALMSSDAQSLVPIDEESRLMTPANESRIAEINDQLRSYVPSNMWENRSLIADTPSEISSITTKTTKQKALPKDPALREARLERELNENLAQINKSLTVVASKEYEINEDILSGLELDAQLAIESSGMMLPAVEHKATKLLEEAMAIMNNTKIGGPDDTEDLLGEADRAFEEYEKQLKAEEERIINSEEYKQVQVEQREYLQKCKDQEKEINNILKEVDQIASKFEDEIVAIDEQDIAEDKMINSEVYVPAMVEPTLEDLDAEIEARVMETFVPPEYDYTYAKELTSENYPLCGEVFLQINAMAAMQEDSLEEDAPQEELKYDIDQEQGYPDEPVNEVFEEEKYN